VQELIASYKVLPKVAKLFLITQFFQSLYFSWPIFYGFATQTITPLQVGLYFSIYSIVKLVAEVPTGAFSDKYGRKASALIGAIISGLVPVVMYFGHTLEAYMACAVLLALGLAFTSGSLDSLVYDDKDISKETYRKVAWLEITLYQIGLITSAALGGLLYQLHPILPFISEAMAWGVSFCLILVITERNKSPSKNKEKYLSYFGTGIRHLLATNYLKMVVMVGVVMAVIITACIEFVNEASMISYGLEPYQRGLLIAAVKIIGLLVVNLALMKILRGDKARMIFVCFVGVVAFLLLGTGYLPVFLMGFILFNWVSGTQFSFFKTVIHEHLPNSHRSTAISGFSAVTGLVAFGAYAFFGWLIEVFKSPLIVYRFCACILLLMVPCVVWIVKQHDKLPAVVEDNEDKGV